METCVSVTGVSCWARLFKSRIGSEFHDQSDRAKSAIELISTWLYKTSAVRVVEARSSHFCGPIWDSSTVCSPVDTCASVTLALQEGCPVDARIKSII